LVTIAMDRDRVGAGEGQRYLTVRDRFRHTNFLKGGRAAILMTMPEEILAKVWSSASATPKAAEPSAIRAPAVPGQEWPAFTSRSIL
jgi:hypothetical protein